jgi:hypothetical protein
MNYAPFEAIRLTFTTGGSTLAKNGQRINQRHGYVVGGFSETLLPVSCSIDEFLNTWELKRDECKEYSIDSRNLVYQTECVGTWIHDGKIYFDVVRIYDDKEAALNIARINDEIAIYDLSTKESINL